MSAVLAPQPSEKEGVLPAIQSIEVTDIDQGTVRVTHNPTTNILSLKTYPQRLEVDLKTFVGKILLGEASNTLTLTVKHQGGPVVLDVSYYWCGHPRDGMIYQTHEYDGQNWKMTKEDDRS